MAWSLMGVYCVCIFVDIFQDWDYWYCKRRLDFDDADILVMIACARDAL